MSLLFLSPQTPRNNAQTISAVGQIATRQTKKRLKVIAIISNLSSDTYSAFLTCGTKMGTQSQFVNVSTTASIKFYSNNAISLWSTQLSELCELRTKCFHALSAPALALTFHFFVSL